MAAAIAGCLTLRMGRPEPDAPEPGARPSPKRKRGKEPSPKRKRGISVRASDWQSNPRWHVAAPTATVTGEKCEFEKGVLYQDMNGRPGYACYHPKDRNVRMFLRDGKVMALYVTRPGLKP